MFLNAFEFVPFVSRFLRKIKIAKVKRFSVIKPWAVKRGETELAQARSSSKFRGPCSFIFELRDYTWLFNQYKLEAKISKKES